MKPLFTIIPLALLAFTHTVNAQTSWLSATTGTWNGAANWSAGVPTGNAVSVTAAGSSYAVNFNTASGYNPFTSITIGNSSSGQTATLNINTSGFTSSGATNVNAFTLNSGGVINVNNTGVFTQTAAAAPTNTINSGGSFNVQNGGSAAIRGVGVNGTLHVYSGGTLSNSGLNLTLNSGGSVINDGSLSSQITINNGGTFSNSGTLSVNNAGGSAMFVGNNSVGQFTMTSGTADFTAAAGGLQRGISVAESSNTGITTSGTYTVSGGTTTNNGTLGVGVTGQTVAGAGSSTGAFTMSGGSWINKSTTGNNSVVLIGGNYATSGTSSTITGSKLTGTMSISGSADFQTAVSTYVGGGGGTGILNISGGTFRAGTFSSISGATAATLMIGASGTNYGSTVTTVGSGTLNLSGGELAVDSLVANRGAGNSSVNFTGGTLSFKSADINTGVTFTVGNGSTAATMNFSSAAGTYSFSNGVTISSNAVLNGQGTMTGALNVVGTLVIAGSGSSGSMNSGAVTLGASSNSYFDILSSGTTFDLLSGTSITYGGNLNLAFGGTYSYGDQFQIFNFGTSGSNFANVISTGLGAGQSAVFNASTGIVTVVPEPASVVLCAFGLGAILIFRKRKFVS